MKNQDVFDFVKDLLKVYYIPMHCFSLPEADISMLDQGLRQSILHYDNTQKLTEDFFQALQHQKLYFLTDSFQCSYMILRLPASEETMVCGPVIFTQLQDNELKDFLDKQQIPQELYEPICEYYQNVAFIPFQSWFLNLFTLLAERLYGHDNYELIDTNFGDLDQWPNYYSQYFRVREQPFASVQMIEERYEDEAALIAAVRDGNEARALEIFSKLSNHLVPARMSNKLRDAKDYCIVVNTLLRKSAESAGVHPIHIDALSNQNVRMIEQLTSLEKCVNFQNECVKHYCQLVRKYTLGKYSAMTRKVLTYISTDLSANLSLKTFADLLSVSPNYLSALFKKEVGISLTEYVNRRLRRI